MDDIKPWVWASAENDDAVRITIHSALGHYSVNLPTAEAEALIKRLRNAIDSAPRVASAADLGIAA